MMLITLHWWSVKTSLILILMLVTSPVLADTADDIAAAMIWKYGAKVTTRGNMLIRWEGPVDVIPPSGLQLVQDVKEYRAYKAEQETNQQQAIDNIKTKLGLTNSDIQALRKAIGS